MNEGKLRILVDLDAVLDTRIATIHAIDPAKAVACYQNDDYYFRTHDDFTDICGISKSEFEAAYAKRNLQTVKQSTLSGVALSLQEIVISLEITRTDHPQGRAPEIDLNVWPYVMDEDTKRYLRAAMANYAGIETVVHIVSIPPERVTVRMLHEHYVAFFTYGFTQWFQMHGQEFETLQIPRVTIFAPSIFAVPAPPESELHSRGLPKELDAIRAVEMGLAPYVAMDFMPTFMYCIYRPGKQEMWVDQAYRDIAPPTDDSHPFIIEERRVADNPDELVVRSSGA